MRAWNKSKFKITVLTYKSVYFLSMEFQFFHSFKHHKIEYVLSSKNFKRKKLIIPLTDFLLGSDDEKRLNNKYYSWKHKNRYTFLLPSDW